MKKYCPECKTENEEQYRFCKNCGTQLEFDAQPYAENFNTPEEFEPVRQQGVRLPDKIAGATEIEVSAFVGKRADKFYGKFLKSEFSGSKVSWCWPVFVLNLFFGFLGGALWFFYRKMHKIGAILLILGVLFAGANTVVDFYANAGTATDSVNPGLLEPEIGDNVTMPYNFFDYLFSSEETPTGLWGIVSDALFWIENVAGSVLLSMFAVIIYKNHVISKITEQRQKHGEEQYYLYTLSICGGTSGGMLAFGIVCTAVAMSATELIPMILSGGRL